MAWIAAEKTEYTIAECCRVLRVSASGFYACQQRPESPHAVRDRHSTLGQISPAEFERRFNAA